MTIEGEWIVLDTNVWIFGLRQEPTRLARFHLLRRLPDLFVRVPRQILLELRANLRHEELDDFFRLLNRHPEQRDFLGQGRASIDPQLSATWMQAGGCNSCSPSRSLRREAFGFRESRLSDRNLRITLSCTQRGSVP